MPVTGSGQVWARGLVVCSSSFCLGGCEAVVFIYSGWGLHESRPFSLTQRESRFSFPFDPVRFSASVCLSLSLFLSVLLCLSVSVSVMVSVSLCHSLSVCLFLCFCLPVRLSPPPPPTPFQSVSSPPLSFCFSPSLSDPPPPPPPQFLLHLLYLMSVSLLSYV